MRASSAAAAAGSGDVGRVGDERVHGAGVHDLGAAAGDATRRAACRWSASSDTSVSPGRRRDHGAAADRHPEPLHRAAGGRRRDDAIGVGPPAPPAAQVADAMAVSRTRTLARRRADDRRRWPVRVDRDGLGARERERRQALAGLQVVDAGRGARWRRRDGRRPRDRTDPAAPGGSSQRGSIADVADRRAEVARGRAPCRPRTRPARRDGVLGQVRVGVLVDAVRLRRSASPAGTRSPSARDRPRRSASAAARPAGTSAGRAPRRRGRGGTRGRAGRGGRRPRCAGARDRSNGAVRPRRHGLHAGDPAGRRVGRACRGRRLAGSAGQRCARRALASTSATSDAPAAGPAPGCPPSSASPMSAWAHRRRRRRSHATPGHRTRPTRRAPAPGARAAGSA